LPPHVPHVSRQPVGLSRVTCRILRSRLNHVKETLQHTLFTLINCNHNNVNYFAKGAFLRRNRQASVVEGGRGISGITNHHCLTTNTNISTRFIPPPFSTAMAMVGAMFPVSHRNSTISKIWESMCYGYRQSTRAHRPIWDTISPTTRTLIRSMAL
jgi:hypothetical protein